MRPIRPRRLAQHQALLHDLRAAKAEQDRNEGADMAKIIVLIPQDQADRAAELLGSSATELPPEGDNRVFAWHTGARRGDDETIVVTLSHALPEIEFDIDWQRSDY